LREDQDRLLKERARKLGVSEAQLVRIALDRFLSGEEGEATAKARASLEAFLAEARHLAGTHRFPEGWRLNREALYAEEAQTAEKQPTNPHTFSLSFPVHPKAQDFTEGGERGKRGVK